MWAPSIAPKSEEEPQVGQTSERSFDVPAAVCVRVDRCSARAGASQLRYVAAARPPNEGDAAE